MNHRIIGLLFFLSLLVLGCVEPERIAVDSVLAGTPSYNTLKCAYRGTGVLAQPDAVLTVYHYSCWDNGTEQKIDIAWDGQRAWRWGG